MTNALMHKVENNDTLVLERVFDAPRELVFEMYKKPEHLKEWWGPTGWTLPVCQVDFRPGGEWLYCMKCEDKNQGDFYGMESWGKAIYKSIDEPNQLVYTDYFCNDKGEPNLEMPSTTVTIDFVDMGGKTKIVSTGKYASKEALDQVIGMGMIQGITMTYDRLDALLQKLK